MKYLKKVKFGDFLVLEPSIQEIAEYFFKYIIECRKNNYITNCGSTLNAQKFVEAEKNPEFKKALQNMDHLRADGISIVWFSKFYGNPVRGRSSTTDFIHRLSEYSSAENRLRYFFLGNTEDVVEKAKTMIEDKYDVEVVGVQHGFFDEDLDEEIVCRINDLKPDVLWIGMGVPKEQYWVFKNRDKLKVPLILTCGGTFNFVARRNLRAPLWIQKIGMEWLFRFFQEPKRLWRRYTLGNILFIWLAFREKFKQKRRTG